MLGYNRVRAKPAANVLATFSGDPMITVGIMEREGVWRLPLTATFIGEVASWSGRAIRSSGGKPLDG